MSEAIVKLLEDRCKGWEARKASEFYDPRLAGVMLAEYQMIIEKVRALDTPTQDAREEALREAARLADEHAAFLHKEAHSGGDFAYLAARRTEAVYLAKRILSLLPPGK